MRHLFLTIILLTILSPISISQIKTATRHKTNLQKEESSKLQYDSTRNWITWSRFLKNDTIKTYKGQTLYVNSNKIVQNLGYSDFINPDYSRYGKPSAKNQNNTKYEDLYGKYFLVKDVIEKQVTLDDPLYVIKYIFSLENINDKQDTCLYIYAHNRIDFPFITIGYYEYLKKEYIGKRYNFYYSPICYYNKKDFNTGDAITNKPNDIWECTDVIIDDKTFKINLLIQNKNSSQTTTIQIYDDAINCLSKLNDYEEKVVNKRIKQYGTNNLLLVKEHKIKVGIPVEILLLSWGKPNKINKSSYGPDQYVYGRQAGSTQYVYVENGKVTAWN